MDKVGLADFILSFIQNLEYISDADFAGRTEYWKYPLETLWDGGGDYEDSTIMCSALLMMTGYVWPSCSSRTTP